MPVCFSGEQPHHCIVNENIAYHNTDESKIVNEYFPPISLLSV